MQFVHLVDRALKATECKYHIYALNLYQATLKNCSYSGLYWAQQMRATQNGTNFCCNLIILRAPRHLIHVYQPPESAEFFQILSSIIVVLWIRIHPFPDSCHQAPKPP